MAMQILPILLLGGGAAYVYKKQKDKARKRSGKDCPPENMVNIGNMTALAAQIAEKFKNEPDPFVEANYAINHLLPKNCNRNSKDSRIKIQIAEKEALDISVPDFYMLVLSNSVGTREQRGMITQDQADAYQAQALYWYKKATGKPFDPSSLGIEAFAQALALAMMEAIKKGKGLPPGPGDQCPDHVVVDMSDTRKEMMAASINGYISGGGRNPFTIATDMFNQLMPASCKRNDFKTTVEVHHNGELFKTYNAASFYAALALTVMEDMIDQGVMTEQTKTSSMNTLRANYKQLTGEELPQNLT